MVTYYIRLRSSFKVLAKKNLVLTGYDRTADWITWGQKENMLFMGEGTASAFTSGTPFRQRVCIPWMTESGVILEMKQHQYRYAHSKAYLARRALARVFKGKA